MSQKRQLKNEISQLKIQRRALHNDIVRLEKRKVALRATFFRLIAELRGLIDTAEDEFKEKML